MNRADVIERIAERYGVTLPQSDPAIFVVDVYDQILQEHTIQAQQSQLEFKEELKKILANSEESLPYLLEIRRQEIDNTANRLQNAAELLHIEQRQKSEIIYAEVSAKLEQKATEFSNQALRQLAVNIEHQINQQLFEPTKQLNRLAKSIAEQQDKDLKRKQLDFAWTGFIGLLCGLIGGLVVIYVG